MNTFSRWLKKISLALFLVILFSCFSYAASENTGSSNIASNCQICNATELVIGGTVEQFNNYCGTDIDAPPTGFNTNSPVWFKFTPNPSRRVFINVNSDVPDSLGGDPIDPELAVFYTTTNECDGELVEIVSQNSPISGSFESLTLECLDPELTYYILVDGSDEDSTGIFSVSVVDRGYPTPISRSFSICQGEMVERGDKIYTNTGVYLDTVINDNCLEIHETNLIVESIELDLRIGNLASEEGENGGVVIANAQSGTGAYRFEWSNGQSNTVANNLIGGQEYCLSVTDVNLGCITDTCFLMEFAIPIMANIINDTLKCANEGIRQIQVAVTAGRPPYQYSLQGIDNPDVQINGMISTNDSIFSIENLPVGTYNIFIENLEDAKRYEAEVPILVPISINLLEQVNVDCPGSANGSLGVEISGGTGELDVNWRFNSHGMETDLMPSFFDPNVSMGSRLLNDYRLKVGRFLRHD